MVEAASYRVLARKYRPAHFGDLIGQEPMVKTLSNAFETGRIAQAWLLTGVRGIGKTTTARILARGLNYQTTEIDRPSIDLSIEGVHCRAIMESRHVDVQEMDAASNTGINDIREIIESTRYKPASARYKVLLSTAAFNGLLKTLEEPPPHVKFIFATTEIRKVPVTILSRCQRFDLRRIEPDIMQAHLGNILTLEDISSEPAALSAIVRASEGSVRDALSLLDQAIAHGGGIIKAETVRDMLGLADRARLIDLFSYLVQGKAKEALEELRFQYNLGADPAFIFNELLDFTHFVTAAKVMPPSNAAAPQAEIDAALNHAQTLSMRLLARLWQMLLKGLEEIKAAPKPVQAAEMAILRITHASDLPPLEEALKKLENHIKGNAAQVSATSPSPAPRASLAYSSSAAPAPRFTPQVETQPTIVLNSLADIAALAAQKRELIFKTAIETGVRLISLKDERLEIALEPSSPPTLANELQKKLTLWTGKRWAVTVSNEVGEKTLREQQENAKDALNRGVTAHPLVQATLTAFPGAQLIAVRALKPQTEQNDYLEPDFPPYTPDEDDE
jgi:DNA polymerase III subunit gamma/tau